MVHAVSCLSVLPVPGGGFGASAALSPLCVWSVSVPPLALRALPQSDLTPLPHRCRRRVSRVCAALARSRRRSRKAPCLFPHVRCARSRLMLLMSVLCVTMNTRVRTAERNEIPIYQDTYHRGAGVRTANASQLRTLPLSPESRQFTWNSELPTPRTVGGTCAGRTPRAR